MRRRALVLAASLVGLGVACRPDAGAESPHDANGDITLPNVDTSQLAPRERHDWSKFVGELPAPCAEQAVSVAQCVAEKRACARCLPAVKFVLHLVKEGNSPEQISDWYKDRYDPSATKQIPLEGSPTRGPDTAPLTIVEFADFECPGCGQMAPILEGIYGKHKDKIRLVYKFFRWDTHPHADIAARAGVAAFNQGKFWEMEGILFSHQHALEQSDLEKYAKDIGLDVERFKADLQAPATTALLDRDKKLEADMKVVQTPTLYVNGHLYDLAARDLHEWIESELGEK